MAMNLLPILLLGGAALFLMSKGDEDEEETDGNGNSTNGNSTNGSNASEGEHIKDCYVYINRITDQAPQGETNVVGAVTIGSSSYSQTQRQLIKETVLPECNRVNKFRQVDMVAAINALTPESLQSLSPEIAAAFQGIAESIDLSLEAFLGMMKERINAVASEENVTMFIGVKSSDQNVQKLYVQSSDPAAITAKFDAMDADGMASEYNKFVEMMGLEPVSGDIELSVDSLTNSSADTVKAVKGAIQEAEITGERSVKVPVRSPNFSHAASVINVVKRLVS